MEDGVMMSGWRSEADISNRVEDTRVFLDIRENQRHHSSGATFWTDVTSRDQEENHHLLSALSVSQILFHPGAPVAT